jgi:hypothetical protein
MANTAKALFRGAATTTTTTTLYTVPAGTTAIVTDIMVSNTSSSAVNFTISLDNVAIATNVNVNGNDTTVIPCKQVLDATKTIKGGASSTSINFSISGVEIS